MNSNPMNNNPHYGKQPYARYTISFQNEGNARKERMNQRIMKQFQDAIKYHKAGKPVPFDELPCPPGKMFSSSSHLSSSLLSSPPSSDLHLCICLLGFIA